MPASVIREWTQSIPHPWGGQFRGEHLRFDRGAQRGSERRLLRLPKRFLRINIGHSLNDYYALRSSQREIKWMSAMCAFHLRDGTTMTKKKEGGPVNTMNRREKMSRYHEISPSATRNETTNSGGNRLNLGIGGINFISARWDRREGLRLYRSLGQGRRSWPYLNREAGQELRISHKNNCCKESNVRGMRGAKSEGF